jgi:hypothetical protein
MATFVARRNAPQRRILNDANVMEPRFQPDFGPPKKATPTLTFR